jgi:hypothetical protein
MSVEPSNFAHMPQVLEQKRNISGIGIGRFPGERAFSAADCRCRGQLSIIKFSRILENRNTRKRLQFRKTAKNEGIWL